MSEFQAIPVWFGIGVVAITLARLFFREMSVRRKYGNEVKQTYRELVPDTSDEELKKAGAWIEPVPLDADTWGYEVDTSREKQMGRFWWTVKTI